MTHVVEERDQVGPELSVADEQALRELTAWARTGGLKLIGAGGLLGKMVIEGALEGELDDHLSPAPSRGSPVMSACLPWWALRPEHPTYAC